MDDFQQLANNLKLLKALDGRPLLGRLTNAYFVNRCLPESQVEVFEQMYDIRLPEEYRRFIIEIGDGGAGPFSEILPLGRYFPLEDDPRLNRLNQPFPHRTSWSEDALSEEEIELYQSDREYLNQLTQGALIIQDFGCAISVLLVVTGERRGSIWMDDTANAGTITPMENGESFLKWYSRWLDEVLKKAADMCQISIESTNLPFLKGLA